MMSKKIFPIGLITSIILAQPAIANSPLASHIFQHKIVQTEIKNFTSVASGGPIQVIITLENEENIRFEGDEEAISTLVAEVKGNTLIIRPKMSWTSWAHKYKDKRITAHVNARTINSLTLSGDGSMTLMGTLSQNSFTATLSGSGSINAHIDVEALTAVISGSGKLDISGVADEAKVTISGSGILSNKGVLKVGNLSSTISGSGAVYIHTDGEIKAFFSGSGHVYYTGNANVTEKVLLGSGKVEKL